MQCVPLHSEQVVELVPGRRHYSLSTVVETVVVVVVEVVLVAVVVEAVEVVSSPH